MVLLLIAKFPLCLITYHTEESETSICRVHLFIPRIANVYASVEPSTARLYSATNEYFMSNKFHLHDHFFIAHKTKQMYVLIRTQCMRGPMRTICLCICMRKRTRM